MSKEIVNIKLTEEKGTVTLQVTNTLGSVVAGVSNKVAALKTIEKYVNRALMSVEVQNEKRLKDKENTFVER